VSAQNYDRWNAKYQEFFVIRWSNISGRPRQVGKSHQTIQAALRAADKADKRIPQSMHFIDVVKP